MPEHSNVIADYTEDGRCIVRDVKPNYALQTAYDGFNRQYFNSRLPRIRVYWAKSITYKEHDHTSRANGIFVTPDSLVKHPYIAIDENLSKVSPFEYLCLLHEMVHVTLGADIEHGEEFVAELKRVLDANKWDLMGCLDAVGSVVPKKRLGLPS
jgi:hypothetical protein